MSWQHSLKRQVNETIATMELKRFITAELPEFRPDRDAQAWRKKGDSLRRRARQNVFLCGFPPEWIKASPKISWGETLHPDPSFRIRKLRYEIVPNYWIPALLYEPTTITSPTAAILNTCGHSSGGKAGMHLQIRCANLARRGALALNMEYIGMGELQFDSPHSRISLLNLTGMAGVGLFLLALQKGLDVLLAHPAADPQRLGVTGLSGGGWQTIIATLDPRVTLAVPVAGYTSLRARVNVPDDVGDLEQVPPNMATVLDYQHLTAMFAPKPLLQILNENDNCCFATARTKPVIFTAIRPVYKACGVPDNLQCHNNHDPGTHNYQEDNRQQLYRFLERHFRLPNPGGDIHATGDIYKETELSVGLPPEQTTFSELARQRAAALAAQRKPPQTADARERLRRELRKALAIEPLSCRSVKLCQTGHASVWRLTLGPWSVPASQWLPPKSESATLMVGDGGRGDFNGFAPMPGCGFMAVDIFNTGENKVDIGLLMLLETTTAKVLGIQVAQILTAAKLLARRSGVARVDLRGIGTVMPIAGLIAAALAPQQFRSLDCDMWLSTFRQLLQGTYSYEETMPLFAFGLLEVTDLPEIKALLEDVVLLQPGRGLPPE